MLVLWLSGMASIRLRPPEQFDFGKPDERPRRNVIFERAQFNSRWKKDMAVLGGQYTVLISFCNCNCQVANHFHLTKWPDFTITHQWAVRRQTRFSASRLRGVGASKTELYKLIEFCSYGNEMLRDRRCRVLLSGLVVVGSCCGYSR